MATTIHEPPNVEENLPGGGNNGGSSLHPPRDEDFRTLKDRPPEPARTGVWIGLAAIAMSFAALTSALIVRQGSGNDWQRIAIPKILFLNTAVLIVSSLTLEIARRKVAGFIRGQGVMRAQAMSWLGATLGLGLVFVAGQYIAWLQLRSEGLYLATNPNSSFFYLLTAVHAIHVLGGLGGLARVVRFLAPAVPILRKSTMDTTSYYWHFMGMLWVYLLCILWLKV
jgi:cytochrome c oxidase subunit 3